MVTLKSLQDQIKKEKDKLASEQKKEAMFLEKQSLQKQLKILKRSPASKKNIVLINRTGKGLKILGKKFGKAFVNQAKRIKEQQMREDAAASKRLKRSRKLAKKGRKAISRNTSSIFSDLDF